MRLQIKTGTDQSKKIVLLEVLLAITGEKLVVPMSPQDAAEVADGLVKCADLCRGRISSRLILPERYR